MKVASVEWNQKRLEQLKTPEQLLNQMQDYIKEAMFQSCDIIVFPAFTGCYYELLKHPGIKLSELKNRADCSEYLELIRVISKQYQIVICTGSYWERQGRSVYHAANIIENGKIELEQRQIYMAQWERELGLERGRDVSLINIRGWKVGIVLSTDVFYSQVSRALAMKGADLILAPIGFCTEKSMAVQLSGVWQQVQQNQFFAVESAFNGMFENMELWGESIIHAPLDITQQENGWLVRSREIEEVITAQLDNDKRKKAILRYNVLSQLNPECYLNMKMFEENT